MCPSVWVYDYSTSSAFQTFSHPYDAYLFRLIYSLVANENVMRDGITKITLKRRCIAIIVLWPTVRPVTASQKYITLHLSYS